MSNTRRYNQKVSIDRKTGRLRYGRTKASEAAERALRGRLPSILAVETPIVASVVESDNVHGSEHERRDRTGAEKGTDAEAAGPAGPAGRAGAAEAATAAGHAGHRQPYDYERDEPTWGVDPGQPEHFEIPQAKQRGPSGPEHVREFVQNIPQWAWILILRQSRPKDGLCQRCKGPSRGAADWRNQAGFLPHISPRVPAGLRSRRRDKGKGPARPASGAVPSGGSGIVAPDILSVGGRPSPQDGMDQDVMGEAEGWAAAEAQPLGPLCHPDESAFEPELNVLYGAYDAYQEIENLEPEEEEGGTDDTQHAPSGAGEDSETAGAAGAAEGADTSTAPAGPADNTAENAEPAGAAGLGEERPTPRSSAAIPRYDLHGFAVLALVHDNGVHGLGVNFCKCEGHLPEHEQLLMAGLFPASTKDPATAYDVGSLEKALIEEVECHTPVESYWKKICRYTVPEDPAATVNKYAITTRVHREFRALREYTEFGFAHQDPTQRRAPQAGEMAYRCIACPYIWNVPRNFESLPQHQKDRYFNAWTIDGNMKAEHTTPRRPGNNVQIFPGTGFLADPDDFARCTKVAKTDRDLPSTVTQDHDLCHQHTAAGAGSAKADPSKDIRGILSICCARHGGMLPGGTVDIYFVENQAQADYALNNSMKLNLDPRISTRLIIGYDIWCQYGVHLLERFRRFGHLSFPEFLTELTGIVGAWHIFAHVRECFGRFSGLYVWGIGFIDMEILETLWSILNMITQSCRNMSRANREETINFNMNDMNLKKIRNMTSTIIRKYKKKVAIRTRRMALLETMDGLCSSISRARWEHQLQVVYRERTVHLRNPASYNAKFMDDFLNSSFITPDKHAVETELIEREKEESDEPGLVKLIMNGLQIEIEQLSWQAFEKNYSPLSESNQRKLSAARASLKARVKKHNTLAVELLGRLPDGDPLFGTGVRLGALNDDEDTEPGEWRRARQPDARQPGTRHSNLRQPEYSPVDLPSSRGLPLDTAVMARAGAYEIALRVAWMAHLLHEICMSLVVQMEIFRRTIKRTPGSRPMTQRDKAQSSSNMREQYQSVRVYAQQYNVFRERMRGLQPAEGFKNAHAEYAEAADRDRGRYRLLQAKDIRCDVNAYDLLNSHTFKLPWFWKLTARREDISDEMFVQEFFRMRWINARAGVDRSDEEIGVLHAEMGMVHMGYGHMAEEWGERALLMDELGHDTHAATAWEREDIWLEFAARAKEQFNLIVPGVIQ
ncbi:unnamed protein product [Peniophora sp. CBMAI 1063]|nr:unnamed protein product [Peniophora sp. CBMAI 1063]